MEVQEKGTLNHSYIKEKVRVCVFQRVSAIPGFKRGLHKELSCPRLTPEHTCGCTSKNLVGLEEDIVHACSCSLPEKSTHMSSVTVR